MEYKMINPQHKENADNTVANLREILSKIKGVLVAEKPREFPDNVNLAFYFGEPLKRAVATFFTEGYCPHGGLMIRTDDRSPLPEDVLDALVNGMPEYYSQSSLVPPILPEETPSSIVWKNLYP